MNWSREVCKILNELLRELDELRIEGGQSGRRQAGGARAASLGRRRSTGVALTPRHQLVLQWLFIRRGPISSAFTLLLRHALLNLGQVHTIPRLRFCFSPSLIHAYCLQTDFNSKSNNICPILLAYYSTFCFDENGNNQSGELSVSILDEIAVCQVRQCCLRTYRGKV